MAGRPGTYVLSWAQTEIDGLRSAPVGALVRGASWTRHGDAHRIDASSDILTLTDPEGGSELRRRAGRAARTILTRAGSRHQCIASSEMIEDTSIERCAVLSDGRHGYPMALIEIGPVARPLVVFTESLPAEGKLLHVVSEPAPIHRRPSDAQSPVLCFTAGTRVSTPSGPVPVDALRPGDLVLTRDAGPQPVLWIGTRAVSGARMHALPALRPIRVPREALGGSDRLDVSPDHRLLLRGAAARALFSSPEVLVHARDLVGWRGIRRVQEPRSTEYVHVMLPSHHVVWAEGVAADTFHPGEADPVALGASQRDELAALLPGGPQHYGGPARRCLSAPETTILLHDGAGRGALRHTA